MISTDAFNNLKKLSTVRQKEVYCPLVRTRAITSPLKVSNDLTIKSAIVSPDLYDINISRLIYDNTIFPDLNNRLSFEDFLNNISYIDRQILLWGILFSSYKTLGKQQIKCTHCDYTFEDTVSLEDIIQEDSITVWDHDETFKDYIFKIVESVDGIDTINRIVFNTGIPSISNHLEILRLIPATKLKENYEKFNSLTTKSEELATVTRSIQVFKTEDDTNPDTFSSIIDIHHVIHEYLLSDFSEDVFSQYNDHFSKYIPKFRKKYACSKCNKPFDFNVDMEVALLRHYFR
jgi:hypothetical protein